MLREASSVARAWKQERLKDWVHLSRLKILLRDRKTFLATLPREISTS